MMNVESSRHYGPKLFCRHILYYLVSFALIGLLLAAIINTLFQYNTWPIYTEVLVVPQNEVKFSAVTMCPLSNGYKLHVLQVSSLIYQSTTAFENVLPLDNEKILIYTLSKMELPQSKTTITKQI